MKNSVTLALLLACVVTTAGGCAGGRAADPGAPPAGVTTEGVFTEARSSPLGANAFTYDADLVPVGAHAAVTVVVHGEGTDVRLAVRGLAPDRGYGAHLHGKPCGTDPKAAGAHYQHTPDPLASETPSTDPSYANPANEVWLDFTTDGTGSASSQTSVAWVASADREPQSLVIHADLTATDAGKAGTAGARLACLAL